MVILMHVRLFPPRCRDRIGAAGSAPSAVNLAGSQEESEMAGAAHDVAVGGAAGFDAALEVEEVPGRGRDGPTRSRDRIGVDGAASSAGMVAGVTE